MKRVHFRPPSTIHLKFQANLKISNRKNFEFERNELLDWRIWSYILRISNSTKWNLFVHGIWNSKTNIKMRNGWRMSIEWTGTGNKNEKIVTHQMISKGNIALLNWKLLQNKVCTMYIPIWAVNGHGNDGYVNSQQPVFDSVIIVKRSNMESGRNKPETLNE